MWVQIPLVAFADVVKPGIILPLQGTVASSNLAVRILGVSSISQDMAFTKLRGGCNSSYAHFGDIAQSGRATS